SLGPFCHSFHLAIPSLLCHRLALSRRLCTNRNAYAPRRSKRWRHHVSIHLDLHPVANNRQLVVHLFCAQRKILFGVCDCPRHLLLPLRLSAIAVSVESCG